jgi:hypothetical protein
MTWLTDRSRYLLGLKHCPAARYYQYHAGDYGYGWGLRRQSVPLRTGIYGHDALAGILGCVIAGVDGDTKLLRSVIQQSIEKYRLSVEATPLTDQDNAAFVAEEQAHLLEALAWGFVRIILPAFKDRFKIVDIEREEAFEVVDGITQMSKPDVVVEDKQTGELALVDFKTAASFSDAWLEGFREDIQGMVGAKAVQLRLKRPVDNYWIIGLCKGGRRRFAKRGVETAEKRQYSHLCYAQVIEPNPPIQPEVALRTMGIWIDKQPVWKLKLPTEPRQSNAEWWAMNIDKETLNRDYMLIGPYNVDKYMVEQYFRGMVPEERRWINKLNDLYEAELNGGWSSWVFQEILDATFPRSYNCFTYFGDRCPYYRLCFKREGWEDPIGSGWYTHRRSHHEPELVQQQERGIPVPLEPWEVNDA